MAVAVVQKNRVRSAWSTAGSGRASPSPSTSANAAPRRVPVARADARRLGDVLELPVAEVLDRARCSPASCARKTSRSPSPSTSPSATPAPWPRMRLPSSSESLTSFSKRMPVLFAGIAREPRAPRAARRGRASDSPSPDATAASEARRTRQRPRTGRAPRPRPRVDSSSRCRTALERGD